MNEYRTIRIITTKLGQMQEDFELNYVRIGMEIWVDSHVKE